MIHFRTYPRSYRQGPGNPAVKNLMAASLTELLQWSRRGRITFNSSLFQHQEIIPHNNPYWIARAAVCSL
jgi:hypothetical protein